MIYAGLSQPDSLPYWLRLLRDHTSVYAAQPYQQLAAAYRAAGHDHAVRRILMAQRDDQINRKAIRGWDRTWARITGALVARRRKSPQARRSLCRRRSRRTGLPDR